MSPRITGEEAAEILRDLARGREDGNGGDVWPLYGRAEDAMAAVVALAADLAAERTRADSAEAQHAELAAAVRAERSARSDYDDADIAYDDGAGTLDEFDAASRALHAAEAVTNAAIAAAPPRSTVPASLVREYLAAVDALRSVRRDDATPEMVSAAYTTRAALVAALAGCV